MRMGSLFLIFNSQNRLISTKSADGILYTEHRISKNETAIVSYPARLDAEYVRAAHIYSIGFSAVRENFGMAGLLPAIQVLIQNNSNQIFSSDFSFLTLNSKSSKIFFIYLPFVL